MDLISVAEAQQRILAHFQPVGTEVIPLRECVNRVLAVAVAAAHDLPPFDNSSMDGFAVRSADLAALQTLRVVADIPAGSTPTVSLGHGEAARIMTGAALPAGADAVIPVEDTDFQDRAAGVPAPSSVTAQRVVIPGENVRPRGMDARTGQPLLPAGRLLRAEDLGLMAMIGLAQVTVYRRPRVALFSSGDELKAVEAELQPGQIHDSNSYVLGALLESAGAEVLRLGVAADQFDSVKLLFDQAARAQADLIVSSAGVSVGAYDYVRAVLESGGKLDFWRVNMRPGKPLAFGEYGGIRFIGLPGNPVSAFVAFEVFVRPLLAVLSGRGAATRPRLRVRLGEAVESDGRETYLRARIEERDGHRVAYLSGGQGSANLLALSNANALLIIPAGVKSAPAEREMDAWML